MKLAAALIVLVVLALVVAIDAPPSLRERVISMWLATPPCAAPGQARLDDTAACEKAWRERNQAKPAR